jgi:two-component system, OmpR family, phosphate regulon response regulator PhoB
MQASTVLVVDGDRAARDALVTCLKFVGVEAHGAAGADAARYWLSSGSADVLVLADELADGAPEEIMRRDGESCIGAALVLRLTRGAVDALTNYTADETLARPVAVSHVVERIESLIMQRQARNGLVLRFGALVLEVADLRVAYGERAVTLGRTESRMLAFFIGLPEKVFSRAQLLQRIWPSNVCVEERTVDVHIRRLRRSLADLGCDNWIQTVRGSGYRFSRLPE